jgi:hypothetical protein
MINCHIRLRYLLDSTAHGNKMMCYEEQDVAKRERVIPTR